MGFKEYGELRNNMESIDNLIYINISRMGLSQCPHQTVAILGHHVESTLPRAASKITSFPEPRFTNVNGEPWVPEPLDKLKGLDLDHYT
jgi:hypothetical protein